MEEDTSSGGGGPQEEENVIEKGGSVPVKILQSKPKIPNVQISEKDVANSKAVRK